MKVTGRLRRTEHAVTAEIRLPQFGMGMQEGTVVEWFKQEGDTVKAGDVVAEVEAAKTAQELVAPADGVLGPILVPTGSTVPVHELLIVLTDPSESAATGTPATVRGILSEHQRRTDRQQPAAGRFDCVT
jgi:pyruvate/2-oxoglutarate dehydrogenase complex dihydrolipoamide acyltransferase (E2) component